jgi:hypothetical protein
MENHQIQRSRSASHSALGRIREAERGEVLVGEGGPSARPSAARPAGPWPARGADDKQPAAKVGYTQGWLAAQKKILGAGTASERQKKGCTGRLAVPTATKGPGRIGLGSSLRHAAKQLG